MASLEKALPEGGADAMLAAATAFEIGRCVPRDEAKAAGYLLEAARRGSKQGVLRLARKFALGTGVPQSYGNAGAWVTGKGLTEERIEPWDYSIGYAHAVLTELLAVVRYPPLGSGQTAEISLVIAIDATAPRRVDVRMTSAPVEGSQALYAAVEQALRTRLVQVLTWLPEPDRRLIVPARVAVPVSIRYRSPGEAEVFEDDYLLK